MAVYEITPDRIEPLPQTTFGAAGVRERADLQRLLRAQIEIIAPDTLVIAEEFGEWEDSRRRIDLLAIDRDAKLVVIELKRIDDGGHMDLQAIRYAAMVSTMTFEQVVSTYAAHLRDVGGKGDARAEILDFLDWTEPLVEQFAQSVRIVLAAADFSVELTTAVMWLNKQGIDVRCVKMAPYRDGARVLIDVQQVIPLPEAEQYVVKIKEKEASERAATVERTSTRRESLFAFWTGLKERAATRTDILRAATPKRGPSLGARHKGPGMIFSYGIHGSSPRLQCYIFGCRAMQAKDIFDGLHADRAAIEARFRRPIDWQRLDEGEYCRIKYHLADDTFSEEHASWPSLQDAMIQAMIDFEAALRPSIDSLGLQNSRED